MRRSTHERIPAITGNYIVHLEAIDYDIEITFDESINSRDSDKWIDTLKDELNSMAINKV